MVFQKTILYQDKNTCCIRFGFGHLDEAEMIGITTANLSILKLGKAKALRFSTLEAICKALDWQPADILEYVEE